MIVSQLHLFKFYYQEIKAFSLESTPSKWSNLITKHFQHLALCSGYRFFSLCFRLHRNARTEGDDHGRRIGPVCLPPMWSQVQKTERASWPYEGMRERCAVSALSEDRHPAAKPAETYGTPPAGWIDGVSPLYRQLPHAELDFLSTWARMGDSF